MDEERGGNVRAGAILWTTAAFLMNAGCYYGSLMGARTLDENELSFSGGVGLPAYLSSDDRREADASGEDHIPVSPSLSVMTGAAEGIDLGLAAYGYGLGPQVRIALLNPGLREALSVTAGANYVIPAKVIGVRGAIAAGYQPGSSLEVYGAWEGGYGPDLINIPRDSAGSRDWTEISDGFYHCVRAGAVYSVSGPDSESWIPEKLTFEFAFPLDLRWNMILVGIGVSF